MEAGLTLRTGHSGAFGPWNDGATGSCLSEGEQQRILGFLFSCPGEGCHNPARTDKAKNFDTVCGQALAVE